jgi:hypothetical protein
MLYYCIKTSVVNKLNVYYERRETQNTIRRFIRTEMSDPSTPTKQTSSDSKFSDETVDKMQLADLRQIEGKFKFDDFQMPSACCECS